MENIMIRKIASHEVESAMDLALEVFMEFEAPDYGPEGVESFKKDIVENPEYLENARKGLCPIYGAFDGEKMVALVGMRSSKTHVQLNVRTQTFWKKWSLHRTTGKVTAMHPSGADHRMHRQPGVL